MGEVSGRGPAAAAFLAGLALWAGTVVAVGPAPAQASDAATTPPPPVTSTTLPPVPAVGPDLTAGQDPTRLLANAIALSSAGNADPSLVQSIHAVQAKLDADETAAVKAQAAAARAQRAATVARAAAERAAGQYSAMSAALRGAVVALYTSAPGGVAVTTRGQVALYAQDYLQSAITPYSVISQARELQTRRSGELKSAEADQRRADASDAEAQRLLASVKVQEDHLLSDLQAVATASAAQLAADHLTLASEASHELLSPDSPLQFTPKTPVPAPLPTTSVALAWAFAELGQPYVWGGTGPDSFDCSGLTQFVWNAAGVSVPRVAADQYAWTVPVPLSDLTPGDLVFFGTADIHHVGIYIGNGLMINAPHVGTDVQVSPIWWSDLAGFGRVHSDTVPVPPRSTPSPTHQIVPAVVPTAGKVPSQTAPPPGWHAAPGETTPLVTTGSGPGPSTTTSSTSSTTSTTSTTTPDSSTTTDTGSTTTTTTTVATTGTTTTTSTVVTGTP
ncbi:MAG: C40 family peptidase [Acidobacteriota bacterium]|nr:C40 family peptidase [Acidobacteriota bacterium]